MANEPITMVHSKICNNYFIGGNKDKTPTFTFHSNESVTIVMRKYLLIGEDYSTAPWHVRLVCKFARWYLMRDF